jgi:hypothetical protein
VSLGVEGGRGGLQDSLPRDAGPIGRRDRVGGLYFVESSFYYRVARLDLARTFYHGVGGSDLVVARSTNHRVGGSDSVVGSWSCHRVGVFTIGQAGVSELAVRAVLLR